MEETNNKTFFNNKSFRPKKSSVNKISSYQRYFLSQEKNDDSKINHNNKNIKNIKYSLDKIFKEPKKFNDGQKIWPKITHPKLPFSNINYEPPELRKLKIKLTKPSKTLHEFNTIKWLRKKYSDSVIEKSIHSILPKKSKSYLKKENEYNKRHKAMLDYLDSFKGPVGREKLIDINPKYLFNESTFNKILKLKEIFLDFDISGNQKMEFDEIVKMFNQNHIKAGKSDIVNLFFKHKIIKRKEDIVKLNLGFYQFINFALKKEQDFRNFMRKIKLKYAKKDNNEYEEKNKESVYLPMNFNLVLDYFIKKEKERHSINKLQKAFDELDKDIKKNDTDKNLNNQDKKNSIVNRSISNQKAKKSIKNFRLNNDNVLLSNININDLFNEFINLFNLSCKNGDNERENLNLINTELNDSSSKLIRNKTENKKSPPIIVDNTIISNNKYNKKIKRYNRNNKSELEKYILLTEPIKNNKNNLITLIKNQMNKNLLNEINIKNFTKYHDVNLARDATIKEIRNELELDNLYIDSKERNRLIKIAKNNVNNKTANCFFTKKIKKK